MLELCFTKVLHGDYVSLLRKQSGLMLFDLGYEKKNLTVKLKNRDTIPSKSGDGLNHT